METASKSARRDLALEPASRASLSGTVADQLAELILAGRLAPGDRLPAERELAIDLGVSRLVVREALRSLAAQGLVEARAGVGTFVRPPTTDALTAPFQRFLTRNNVTLAHLFALRRTLEPQIASLAATEADSEQRAALGENLRRTEAAAAELDSQVLAHGAPSGAALEAFAWLDLEFHRVLAAATANPLFEVVLRPLIDRQLAVRRDGARVPGQAARAAAAHAAILESVNQRDPDAARRSMEAHLDAVESWLLPLVRV